MSSKAPTVITLSGFVLVKSSVPVISSLPNVVSSQCANAVPAPPSCSMGTPAGSAAAPKRRLYSLTAFAPIKLVGVTLPAGMTFSRQLFEFGKPRQ